MRLQSPAFQWDCIQTWVAGTDETVRLVEDTQAGAKIAAAPEAEFGADALIEADTFVSGVLENAFSI